MDVGTRDPFGACIELDSYRLTTVIKYEVVSDYLENIAMSKIDTELQDFKHLFAVIQRCYRLCCQRPAASTSRDL